MTSLSTKSDPQKIWYERYEIQIVVAIFVTLTLIVSWPLPRYFGTYLAGQDSDVPINLWANWWTSVALSGPDSIWQTDLLFYPLGADLTFHSFSHLNSVAALLLQPFLGQIAAYNSVVLANYILAGLAMYQLVRHLTGSRLAALLAGIVFAFNSHNQYQSAHPVLLSIWCLPWATLVFLKINEHRSKWQMIGLGLMIIITAATSTLLLIMLGLWLAALALYVWVDPARTRPAWLHLIGAAAIGIVGSLVFLWPLISAYFVGDNGNFIITTEDILYISDILSPLIPHWYVWLVRGLYIGLVPLILLIGARHRWRFSRLWYGLFFLAYLFSIGPFPILAGQQLDIVFPWSNLIVPLLRNPYRLNIYLSFGLAVLVAHGWLALAEANFNTVRHWRLGFLLTAALIFAEYSWPTFPLTHIEISGFYSDYLDELPDDIALAVVPANRSIGKTYMYLQTAHGHPISSGTISRRDEAIFAYQEGNPLLHAALDQGQIEQLPASLEQALADLANAGVGFVVVHKEFLEADQLEAWVAVLGDRPVYEDHLVVVYETTVD